MSAAPRSENRALTSFRAKLLIAMMLVISGLTALGLYFAQRNVAAETERNLQRDFHNELASLHRVQEVRHAALAERCRTLVRRPRIHAAFEDDALDLLYPSAKDELRDIMAVEDEPATHALHARFYRFLDRTGAVISPANAKEVGELTREQEVQLSLPGAPAKQQIGYISRSAQDPNDAIEEVIAVPIVSHESGDAIGALVLGFKPLELGNMRPGSGIKSGICVNDRLHLPRLDRAQQATLSANIAQALTASAGRENSFQVDIEGVPHLLFYKRLNPDSLFAPAYEVCIYPLTESLARQRQLFWQVLGAGGLLLLGGFGASHILSGRLSRPVEKLVIDSQEQRAQRERAEAALELTHEELQRSARFSADASHQLKTPVTVLRAGLEELLARDNLSSEQCQEISALVHQTYRLANIIEDLLLLSRMDAGRMQIDFSAVHLTPLIEALVDDLSAFSGAPDVEIDSICPSLPIAGEKRYVALILQNLLENARKYNCPNGRIRIACRDEGEWAIVTIGNTGRPISPAAREHIFERFHRGAIGENVPGYGLGLNLARELARIHGGDVRLARSDELWTEFEARFQLAKTAQKVAVDVT